MSPKPPLSDRLADATRTAATLLKQGKAADAEDLLKGALRGVAGGATAWVLLGKAQQMRSDFRGMAQSAATARSLAPGDQRVRDFEIEALLLRGALPDVKAMLVAATEEAGEDAAALGQLAERAVQIADYAFARTLLDRALDAAPGDPRLLFNRASVLVALGKIAGAKADLQKVVVAEPLDGDAWYNLVTLERLENTSPTWLGLQEAFPRLCGTAGEMPARFARAKALEDQGEHEASWSELTKANGLRRARLSYDVRADVAIMEQIARAFGECGSSCSGDVAARPIFVVGMPRSGTTLVDRILSTHESVASVGEVNDLALAIMEETGEVASKQALVERSALTEPSVIDANYLRRMAARTGPALRTVDKTPLNFLYLGLIARALPQASIVHLERDPRDIAFAVYKTLFRMGYPFAYSLDDIADYMIAKHALMKHWTGLLGQRIVTVRYEDLVTDIEGESRRLFASLGLDWTPAALAFHRQASPSATASAVQVREPVHSRSVGAWKRHAEALARLEDRFAKAGML